MPWSPRNCGLLAFWVWQILAALCIAKHRVYVAWHGKLTGANAMIGARYHVVSDEQSMVSNPITSAVSLSYTTLWISGHDIFGAEIRTLMLTGIKLHNLKPKESPCKMYGREQLDVAVIFVEFSRRARRT